MNGHRSRLRVHPRSLFSTPALAVIQELQGGAAMRLCNQPLSRALSLVSRGLELDAVVLSGAIHMPVYQTFLPVIQADKATIPSDRKNGRVQDDMG